MSKKFKGEPCVYCAKRKMQTLDHVFARAFVPSGRRATGAANTPKVPACSECNKQKSDLELYLSAVLPFGGAHSDAGEQLVDGAARRLAKNQKLHRELQSQASNIWLLNEAGSYDLSLTVPIDGEKLEQLFALIARGLVWHHWKVLLNAECFVQALTLTKTGGEPFFKKYMSMNAAQRVEGNIGDGALVYRGHQGTDNPVISVWVFTIYGGAQVMGDDHAYGSMSIYGAITGPTRVLESAAAKLMPSN